MCPHITSTLAVLAESSRVQQKENEQLNILHTILGALITPAQSSKQNLIQTNVQPLRLEDVKPGDLRLGGEISALNKQLLQISLGLF